MGKFMKYRIHFDINPTNGLLIASSDPIQWDQVEEYKRVFGCGEGRVNNEGVLYWYADAYGQPKNSISLAKEWLKEMERVYPNKANVIMAMLK